MIREFKDYIKRKDGLPDDLMLYLEMFPDDALSWREATDEVREIAKTAREFIADYDGVKLEPFDFKNAASPAEFNKGGKEFITSVYLKMSEECREKFLEEVRYKFDMKLMDESVMTFESYGAVYAKTSEKQDYRNFIEHRSSFTFDKGNRNIMRFRSDLPYDRALDDAMKIRNLFIREFRGVKARIKDTGEKIYFDLFELNNQIYSYVLKHKMEGGTVYLSTDETLPSDARPFMHLDEFRKLCAENIEGCDPDKIIEKVDRYEISENTGQSQEQAVAKDEEGVWYAYKKIITI